MNKFSYSTSQLYLLLALRLSIGWHFLYEGVVKVFAPSWSSYGYLIDSKGILANVFVAIASNPTALAVADFLNVWGLVAVGLGLMCGCFARFATIGGIVLLSFYYLSHPALIGVKYAMPSEGAYLWVNKNIIEIAALAVLLVFPTSKCFGFDRYIFGKRRN